MVLDNVKNLGNYKSLIKSMDLIEKFVEEYKASPKEKGQYLLRGWEIRANVSTYETKTGEDCYLEAHKKYIDIQYVTEGEENIGWANVNSGLKIRDSFNEDKDIGFYDGECESMITVKKDNFVILFPEDAHMPCLSTKSEPTTVTKIVFKIICE